jgi:hypothetical protein
LFPVGRAVSTAALSDIPPPGTAFFEQASAAWPPPKQQLTIRLDADVLDWLKGTGRGYQTRINHILRAAMESTPLRRSHSKPVLNKSTRTSRQPPLTRRYVNSCRPRAIRLAARWEEEFC